MPKFIGVTLQTLNERLGPAGEKGMSPGSTSTRHRFHMVWQCQGPSAPACFAYTEAPDTPMPANLSPWEQELFDNAPLPKHGWTLKPCPQHRNVFADFPEEPD